MTGFTDGLDQEIAALRKTSQAAGRNVRTLSSGQYLDALVEQLKKVRPADRTTLISTWVQAMIRQNILNLNQATALAAAALSVCGS